MEENVQPVREGGGKRPRTTIDLVRGGAKERRMVPVWFFVGLILLVYGVLIFLAGLMEFSRPPSTALSNLHPAIWWGALLTVIGAIYVYLFLPRKPY